MIKFTYRTSLFIFHRSFRITDNLGLNYALSNSKEVIPLFIFNLPQSNKTSFFSPKAFQFMINSLKELEQKFEELNQKLNFFQGKPDKVLENIQKEFDFDCLIINRDYTPFAIERENSLSKFCQLNGIKFQVIADCLLNEPETIKTQKNTYYTVFTPFYKNARKFQIQKPIPMDKMKIERLKHCDSINSYKLSEIKTHLNTKNEQPALNGGRKEALKILTNLGHYQNYHFERDYPSIAGTTKLSAHLKFGTVSIREVAHQIAEYLGENHPLLRQLYWRDFFTHIAFHYPLVFHQSFREKYRNLKWINDKSLFEKWCNAKTGFPIIDAGIIELNKTGFMHNRVRMITASFLTKDLHIHWKWGEKYFAEKLIDYDPSVNNGNWQWAASTGCDAQPYFRIFNPWSQQKKFDPDALYIKKWIPVLRRFTAELIHNLWKKRPSGLSENDYPSPIVDHKRERQLALFMFKINTENPKS